MLTFYQNQNHEKTGTYESTASFAAWRRVVGVHFDFLSFLTLISQSSELASGSRPGI